jgi:hypothetical protein
MEIQPDFLDGKAIPVIASVSTISPSQDGSPKIVTYHLYSALFMKVHEAAQMGMDKGARPGHSVLTVRREPGGAQRIDMPRSDAAVEAS